MAKCDTCKKKNSGKCCHKLYLSQYVWKKCQSLGSWCPSKFKETRNSAIVSHTLCNNKTLLHLIYEAECVIAKDRYIHNITVKERAVFDSSISKYDYYRDGTRIGRMVKRLSEMVDTYVLDRV